MFRKYPENMSYILWLILQSLFIATASFFLIFGISLFRAAYRLKDPFSFIMTIFASNLIVLISAVLLIGFIYRIYNVYTLRKKTAVSKSTSGQE